jgi:hypothetical protein
MNTKHPIQPLVTDDRGTVRFKANAIVRHLLDHGGIDMNQLASLDFSDEDRMQFAQLIGYSVSGFGELSYVDDETYGSAEAMCATGVSDLEARNAVMREQLAQLRAALRDPMAALFGVHPDDLVVGDA